MTNKKQPQAVPAGNRGGRPKKTMRPIPFNLSLDEDLHARLELELFSELEGKVPHGAKSSLINLLVREHFRKVDIAAKMAKAVQEQAEVAASPFTQAAKP